MSMNPRIEALEQQVASLSAQWRPSLSPFLWFSKRPNWADKKPEENPQERS